MDNQATLSADRQRLLALRLKGAAKVSGEPRRIPKRAATASTPLSSGQHQMWIIDQMTPGDPAYNIPIAHRIRGELDVHALQESFNRIIQRHESWRTTFRECEGNPVQEIHAKCEINIGFTDLGYLPAADRESKLLALAAEEAARPFDLRRLPLLRVSLFKAGEDEHVLLITLHHIIFDVWSYAVFARELTAHYAAIHSGQPNPLPDLTLQYGDYACWQREKCADAPTASQIAFWRERLGGDRAPLPVPADRPRPARQSHRGGMRVRDFSAALAAKVRDLARGEGVTLFILTLAAFKALLARYSGETDICIGSPIAQRPNVETECLIGYFLNTLALRSDLSGDPDFRELLRRVRSTALDAFQHQDVPFENVVEDLHPTRDLSHQPIFQIAFVLLPPADTVPSFAGATAVPFTVPVTTAKFDLTLFIEETPGGMRAMMEYAADQFEAATADRMLESLELLLEGIVADPSTPLSRLPILSAGQRQRILTEWSGSERPYPQDQTIAARFAECVARTPAAIAVIEDGGRLTYSELDARTNRVAHFLQSQGIRAGDFVGLRAERSLAFVVKVLGIAKAGAAYVPLDDNEPATRLERMKTACALILDAEPGADVSADPIASDAQPDGPAYVLFTSGSTGVPKGAIIPHCGITRLVVNNDYAPFQADDVVAFASNVCFDAATFEIWGALLNGGSLVITPRDVLLSPAALAAHLAVHRVTVLFLTTSLFNRLAHEAPAMFGGLRILVFGGEAADAASVRLVVENGKPQRLVNGYGPTETTTFAICHTVGKCEGSSIPIGRPIANTRVFLLDSLLQPVPIGVASEIYIGGPGVALGYHAAPELTAEKFVATPYGRLYRTGDLGRWLPDGTIEYLGRADQQVKLRGFRIELGEIEFVLMQHAAIREAVVIARTDSAGKTRLVAYLVSNTTPSADELRAHLKARLPDHMIPSAFVFLSALPLTDNGKLDRRALPEPEPVRSVPGSAHAVPRTPVEQTLADIWAKVLRLDHIGVHDNFFALGGDSILSIQIIARAREAGMALTPKDLFEHQTIAELAMVAEPLFTTTANEQGLVRGEAPLTAVQHWFFEQELAEMHHWNQAFVFALSEPIEPALLARAAAAVERHHDALRLRFQRDESGTWRQHFAAEPATGILDPEPFDLACGPLWRLIQSAPDRLAITVHHLAVDGVSWRILLEDLETACTQLRAGQAVRLPPKTTSFKDWSERLHAFARSGVLDAELEYWRAVTGPALATDFSGENIESSARTILVSLTAEETAALLHRVPAAYRTQINDVLLTALAQTFGGTVHLDLEGHGREDVIEGADLSRTVGWFTSIFPITLDLHGATAPGEALKRTKEQLRAIPRRGLGYGLLRYLAGDPALRGQPQPGLVFNYLGQFDQVVSGSRLFRFAPEDGEPFHSPRAGRRHLLEINSLILGDRLEFRFAFSTNCHRTETVERIANDYLHALRLIIGHCLASGSGGCTPSDFPLTRLDQESVDLLAGSDRNIEDICPLSAMQALFYSLGSVEGHPADQWQCRLRGRLDVAALQRAWREVYQRHSILRTAFRSEGLPEAVQIVFRHLDLPWTIHDWRSLAPDEQAAHLDEFLRADRERGFDLSQPPLTRFALLRLRDDEHHFVWSLPDLLIDGWSWPIIFKELGVLYDAGDQRLDRARPYREYIAWLKRQTLSEAGAFWRQHLAGRTAPTALPLATGRDEDGFCETRVSLSAEATTRLNTFARERQLTPGTLVHAAWALVLARQSASDDVLFGATFSGRPTDLPGAESIVGMFVNNLPVRARFSRDDSVLSLAHALQNEIFSVSQHQFTPLLQVQGWSEIPWRHRLFESLVVFQNYAVDESALRLGSGVEIHGFDGPTHTNYALTLIAYPGPALGLTLIHRRGAFDAVTGAALLDDVRTALDSIICHSEETISRALERLAPPLAGGGSAPVRARSFTPPKNEMERIIAGIWAEAFGLDQIGTHENFFDLGGRSLLATRIIALIAERLGRRLEFGPFFSHPTIAALAQYISGGTPAAAFDGKFLMPIQRGNPAMRPLFLVPGGWGGAIEFFVYGELSKQIDPALPIWGLKARGAGTGEPPHVSVAEMAADYVREMRRIQPHGPYRIAGECVGGVCAYEMACQLENAGEEVALLVLLDTTVPADSHLENYLKSESLKREAESRRLTLPQRIRHHFGKMAGLSLGKKFSYVFKKAARRGEADPVLDGAAIQQHPRGQKDYPVTLLRHRLKPYGGTVTLLLDEESSRLYGQMGWDAAPVAHLETHILPGTHLTYIRENAPVAAAKIRELLQHSSANFHHDPATV